MSCYLLRQYLSVAVHVPAREVRGKSRLSYPKTDHLFARKVGAGLEAAVSSICFHLALCLSAFDARRGLLRGLLRASVALKVRLLQVWVCVLCASSKLVVLLVILIFRTLVRVLAALTHPAVAFVLVTFAAL